MNGLLDRRDAVRRPRRRAAALLTPVVAFTLGVVAACAPEEPQQARPSGTTDQECGPEQLARAPDCRQLHAAARRDGEASVVVTLTTPFTPEGRLDDRGRERQRRAIAAGQDALLDQLTPHRIRVLARYHATPQLALLVDLPALRALLTSDLVAQVQQNTPQPPG